VTRAVREGENALIVKPFRLENPRIVVVK